MAKGAGSQGQSGGEGKGARSQSGREGEEDNEAIRRGGERIGLDHDKGFLPCAFYLFIRVMEITDILSQNVPLEDVQYLAGHSNLSLP